MKFQSLTVVDNLSKNCIMFFKIKLVLILKILFL